MTTTAGLPESWPFVGLTDEWYESLPIRSGPDEYAVATARSPWVRWWFEKGLLGEHARWALDLSLKYRRARPWKFWTTKDIDPAIGMRFFHVGLLERTLARVLTAVAVYEAVRAQLEDGSDFLSLR